MKSGGTKNSKQSSSYICTHTTWIFILEREVKTQSTKVANITPSKAGSKASTSGISGETKPKPSAIAHEDEEAETGKPG